MEKTKSIILIDYAMFPIWLNSEIKKNKLKIKITNIKVKILRIQNSKKEIFVLYIFDPHTKDWTLRSLVGSFEITRC